MRRAARLARGLHRGPQFDTASYREQGAVAIRGLLTPAEVDVLCVGIEGGSGTAPRNHIHEPINTERARPSSSRNPAVDGVSALTGQEAISGYDFVAAAARERCEQGKAHEQGPCHH